MPLLRLKEVLIFTSLFGALSVIGTLSHEYGHIAVAEYLGYETTLHYSSMSWNEEQQNAGKASETFFSKNEERKPATKTERERLLVAIGGPVQTTLTGTIGLLILLARRRSRKVYDFKWVDWIAVFLSLFWLRQIFNVIISISEGALSGVGKYFGGDEARISRLMDWHYSTLPVILGTIGLIISAYVTFKVVPRPKRAAFITGGFIGAGLGYGLWMFVVGPVLLP